MPRVKAPTVAEHRRNVLSRMYGAFESLVREHGYDALTLADIAKAAGLARTGIYNYFPDKEALLVAYTAHTMDGFFSDLRAALSEVDDPLARLDVYVSCHVRYVAGHRLAAGGPLRAVLSAGAYQSLHQHTAALADTLAQILAEAAAEGQLPRAVADDEHTVRLLVAGLATGTPPDLPAGELDAAIAGAQRFVRRAVSAAQH